MKWSDNLGLGNATNIKERAYAYTYDLMNRIKTAQHSQHTSAWTANNHFKLDGLTYDLNGNIESLTRKGQQGNNIDALAYTYSGNQLLSVADSGDDTEGFKDGTNPGDDYLYDDNGNMTQDLNKDITSITYNHLNLPARVEKDANNYILYTYDASGIKLRQDVYQDGALTKTTDYVGEFIYENDELQLIQHEEGRIVPALDAGPRTYEYQYYLKDHLGNTRVVFTTDPKTIDFGLNYESNSADPDDEALFDNLQNVITADVHDRMDAGNESFNHTNVQLLNGAANGVVGSVLTIPVGAGDKVSAEVYAKYLAPTGTNNPTAAIGNLVIGAITGTTGTGIYEGAITSGYGSGGTVASLINANASSTEPMAFINLLFLPDDVTGLIASSHFAFKQITSASSNNQAILALDQPYEAPEAGYVVVYLSNESAQLTEVYFDDLKVTVNEHPVIETADYYPFGLTFNSYQRVTAEPNRYKFTGKERITDLGLNWDDFGARMYMPDIGRWGVIDPAADVLEASSPFVYSLNSPINYIDLDGELPILINGRVSSNDERADASYWNAQLLETIKNSGIPNPGGDVHFVDGDRGLTSRYINSRLSIKTLSSEESAAMSASFRKRAGAKVAEDDFETILSKLERDPESGKIIEKIQIYTHSRGSAFGEGYTSTLLKLISARADEFEDASNVVQYSLNLAPHQSNSINAVEGVPTIGISHKADILSGNDIEGAVNVHSEVGNVATSHGNGSFTKEVGATISAILSSDKKNTSIINELKSALEKLGIDFSIKQK